MNGEKCIKKNCGCTTELSSTIYWCNECNIPIFETICPVCGSEGTYIATDMRPVFPEENALISLILADDPKKYQSSSVWFGSGVYIVDGKKVKLPITKVNNLPIEEIKKIKEKYEVFASCMDHRFFNLYIEKFIKANADRYNYITGDAMNKN